MDPLKAILRVRTLSDSMVPTDTFRDPYFLDFLAEGRDVLGASSASFCTNIVIQRMPTHTTVASRAVIVNGWKVSRRTTTPMTRRVNPTVETVISRGGRA